MNLQTNCVIFDLDGTLLYTLEDLYLSVNYALEVFNYPPKSVDEVRSFVGNGIKKLIERSVPQGVDEENINKCLRVFRQYYANNSQKHTRPYDGIIDVLEYLKQNNIKIGVNSNKYDAAVKELCRKYFYNYISYAVGECPNCPPKPSPYGVQKILKELKCTNAVYVGDSLVDIQTAKNACMPCISVSWGYCAKDKLEANNPGRVVDTAFGLQEMLRNMNCAAEKQ